MQTTLPSKNMRHSLPKPSRPICAAFVKRRPPVRISGRPKASFGNILLAVSV